MRDFIIDTPVRGGPGDTPLTTARLLADAELANKASADDQLWLRQHPVLWLRALARIRDELENHIAKSHADLIPLKPRAGESASQEYLDAKARVERKNQGRMHLRALVIRRIDEVASLCGITDAHRTVGDVVAVLARIATLIDQGKTDNAKGLALATAGRLVRAHGHDAAPDNSAATPINVIVYGLRPTTKLNCRACGKGKLTPTQTTCPRCQQRHILET